MCFGKTFVDKSCSTSPTSTVCLCRPQMGCIISCLLKTFVWLETMVWTEISTNCTPANAQKRSGSSDILHRHAGSVPVCFSV